MATRILRANRSSLIAALLAVLLLPMVSVAHSHAGDHDALHGDLGAEACLVCQVASGKTGFLPPQQGVFPAAGDKTAVDLRLQSFHPRPVRAMPFWVRGPPDSPDSA